MMANVSKYLSENSFPICMLPGKLKCTEIILKKKNSKLRKYQTVKASKTLTPPPTVYQNIYKRLLNL